MNKTSVDAKIMDESLRRNRIVTVSKCLQPKSLLIIKEKNDNYRREIRQIPT